MATRWVRQRPAGFTYVGVLVLVVIMGVWLMFVGQVWHTMQKREKEEELLFVGDQFRRAIAAYYASAAGYPKRLEDLTKDPRYPAVRRYLRKVYADPVTGRAEWGLVKGPSDTIIGVHSLSEQEPVKKAGFALADQDFQGKKKYSEWVFTAKATAAAPATPAPASASSAVAFTPPPPPPGNHGAAGRFAPPPGAGVPQGLDATTIQPAPISPGTR
jgi:type II secretory pathway pseudopilin PulG